MLIKLSTWSHWRCQRPQGSKMLILRRKIIEFDVDENGWPTPFPIEDSATVNERRARLGLNPIEERQEQMTEQERKRREREAQQQSSD